MAAGPDTSTDHIAEGSVSANGLTFSTLAVGDGGPLALCLHGFPDTAWTWRHLLGPLAAAGFRAVAPFMRGYAPTGIPTDGYYGAATLAQDAGALHDALGGGSDAVLIGHDWGALAAYPAAVSQPDRWSRVVVASVPPPPVVAQAFFSYDQLRRSWYMFFFQHPLAQAAVAMGDLDFVARLWADWSPGYDASWDLARVRDAIGDDANLEAALGYYRATLGDGPSDPDLAEVDAAASQPLPQPALYLHGAQDGCMGAGLIGDLSEALPVEGSRTEIIDDAGHFLQLEQPEVVNRLIVDFCTGG